MRNFLCFHCTIGIHNTTTHTIILFLINNLPLFHSEAVKYHHQTYHILLPTIEADSVHQWNLFIAFNNKCRDVPIVPCPRFTLHFRNWQTFGIMKTVWLRSGWGRIKVFLCFVTAVSLAEERKWSVLNDDIVTVSVSSQIYGIFWTFLNMRIRKTQLDVTFCILYFSSNSCSTCFGQPCAHHQELTTAWCYSLVLVCAVAAGRLSRPVGM